MNDILDTKLNRVTVQVCPQWHIVKVVSKTEEQAPEGGRLQKRSYDLDSKDFFWAKNAASPFPQVAEEIDAELTK